MGLFSKKTWEEEDAWDGNGSQQCPKCGEDMTKKYQYSDWWCENCHSGLYDEEDNEEDNEQISVWDAADIWMSHGKDEDYMFGYTEEELENALR